MNVHYLGRVHSSVQVINIYVLCQRAIHDTNTNTAAPV